MMMKFLSPSSAGFSRCTMGLGEKNMPSPFFIVCNWEQILSSSMFNSLAFAMTLSNSNETVSKKISTSLNNASPWRALFLLSLTLIFNNSKSFSIFDFCCWKSLSSHVPAEPVTPTMGVSFLLKASSYSKIWVLSKIFAQIQNKVIIYIIVENLYLKIMIRIYIPSSSEFKAEFKGERCMNEFLTINIYITTKNPYLKIMIRTSFIEFRTYILPSLEFKI